MRRHHLNVFSPLCPVCTRAGRTARPVDLVYTPVSDTDDIQTGILQCPDTRCKQEYPIIDGIPMLVPDVKKLLTERGTDLLLRQDLDPVVESLIGDNLGSEGWFDGIRRGLSTYAWDSWGDLDPLEIQETGTLAPGAAKRCLQTLLGMIQHEGDIPFQPSTIVDLGCGAGRTTVELAQHFPTANVLGIDMHLGVLRIAQGAIHGQVSYPRRHGGIIYDRRTFPVSLPNADHADYWACDATALPFAEQSADLTVALNLLDCVPNPRDLLTQCARILRPGGYALLATPFDWSARWTPVENWIGGRAQRTERQGRSDVELRNVVENPNHPQHVPGFQVVAHGDFPWYTRLHDRSAVSYTTHVIVLQRT